MLREGTAYDVNFLTLCHARSAPGESRCVSSLVTLQLLSAECCLFSAQSCLYKNRGLQFSHYWLTDWLTSLATYISDVACMSFRSAWSTRKLLRYALVQLVGALLKTSKLRVWFPMGPLRFFIDIIPPATMAMGSTQPLGEMSTGDLPWEGKGGRYIGLTNLPYLSADCLKFLRASIS
jgi:hypothetical protein